MSPKKSNQPISQTPTLQIDAATFQAAVSAAVTTVLNHLNANYANVSGMVFNNSNPSNNQVHPRVTNYHDTPNLKPKSNKRKFWDRVKGKSPRGTNKKPSPVAAFAATTSLTPTTNTTSIPIIPNPARQYAGNLPNCNKCNFHHLGSCRLLHCKTCNKNGHTTRFCRTRVKHITSTTNVETSRICHLCGLMGHFKRDCPTEKNDRRTGGV